jgi:hypothetical protein
VGEERARCALVRFELTPHGARSVRLVPANDEHGDWAEYFADATDDISEAIEWTMPPGRSVDAMALLVLTTASLRAGAARYPNGDWDVRRFLPNVLVDGAGEGWTEDAWCGRAVGIGSVKLLPGSRVSAVQLTDDQDGVVGRGRRHREDRQSVPRSIARTRRRPAAPHRRTFSTWPWRSRPRTAARIVPSSMSRPRCPPGQVVAA